jgi:HEAT repeat protein
MKGNLLQRVAKDIAALGSPNEEVARRAEHRLCRSAARLRRAGGKVIERLLEATGHPNPHVRFRALWVLAATRAPGAYNTVLALTRDPDAAVRYDAAMALGRFGYAVAALEEIGDPGYWSHDAPRPTNREAAILGASIGASS